MAAFIYQNTLGEWVLVIFNAGSIKTTKYGEEYLAQWALKQLAGNN